MSATVETEAQMRAVASSSLRSPLNHLNVTRALASAKKRTLGQASVNQTGGLLEASKKKSIDLKNEE